MNDLSTRISKHDIAYACFLPFCLLRLIIAISVYFPMDTGTAGGIGFLVLIPLTLASLATVTSKLQFVGNAK